MDSGIGFTLSLTFLGSIRELLGNGSIFGISLVPANFTPALIFILAPGGFITIGMIMACINIKKERDAKKKKVTKK
ncbi:RnfE protein [Fusobacterium vincentii ATCC 49256]|uniref:RnfE protein n=1 Tax=Fusobacterium vincentii ATCC 49256 TaxID=209882 RepID=Q7P7D4_FUSVC|nr:RnfE protein [Fusobacterium vincentii ATCC 49256]